MKRDKDILSVSTIICDMVKWNESHVGRVYTGGGGRKHQKSQSEKNKLRIKRKKEKN